jgi:hypothetical protein
LLKYLYQLAFLCTRWISNIVSDQYVPQSWDSEAVKIKARLQIKEIVLVSHGDDDREVIARSRPVALNWNFDDDGDVDDATRRSAAQEQERGKERKSRIRTDVRLKCGKLWETVGSESKQRQTSYPTLIAQSQSPQTVM